MVRIVRWLLIALALVCVVGADAGAAGAGAIKPHQQFVGLVNGSRRDAVVYTVCPGPAGGSRMGSVAGNQTMSVLRVHDGHGDTGPFSQVYAWFVPTSSSKPVQLTFVRYRTPQYIPPSVQVPCDGSGRVEFSSCPYLAPCAAGWVPTYVRVHFENIAV
jgi:hypothetical protein